MINTLNRDLIEQDHKRSRLIRGRTNATAPCPVAAANLSYTNDPCETVTGTLAAVRDNLLVHSFLQEIRPRYGDDTVDDPLVRGLDVLNHVVTGPGTVLVVIFLTIQPIRQHKITRSQVSKKVSRV